MRSWRLSNTTTLAPACAASEAAAPPAAPAPSTTTLPRWVDGHAAQQLALAALRTMQQRGADLRGDASGNDRHRRQQRQRAVLFHRLEGHAGQADVQQALGQLRLGGQMQVAEQQVMLLQQCSDRRRSAP